MVSTRSPSTAARIAARWNSSARAGIDDGDGALADDVGAGAVEGERRGVRRDEAAHARRKPRQFAQLPLGEPQPGTPPTTGTTTSVFRVARTLSAGAGAITVAPGDLMLISAEVVILFAIVLYLQGGDMDGRKSLAILFSDKGWVIGFLGFGLLIPFALKLLGVLEGMALGRANRAVLRSRGVFKAIRESFCLPASRKLLDRLTAVNDFRNTYVAHHEKELNDKTLTERSLKHWVETLVLLRV